MFIFKDSSYIYLSNLNASDMLRSPLLKTSEPITVCLKLWYKTYQIENLKNIWIKSSNQSVDWKQIAITMKLTPPGSFIHLQAVLDELNYGRIAIGKIEFKKGKCSNETTSEFNRKRFPSMLSKIWGLLTWFIENLIV